ncbi:MAG: Rne/Rng family ribonuclease [Gammaproteobacteria bacterium WSBS_2016_MAG_OTU1]
MNRIYINTRQLEERRIIIVENDSVVGFEQDVTGWENKKGDIYKAIVTRIEDGLDAAFVDFGESKNGFLPLKNIYPDSPGVNGKNKIAEGDSILVQIKKDHVTDKGAGMTTNISLAGCYLVLVPGQSKKLLMSKNLSGRERHQIMETMEELNVPEGMGVIVRTAGIGRPVEDLRWDLESYLLRLWAAIESAAKANQGPILIYRENNLLLRAVRDYFTPGEHEIYCDDPESYQEVKSFVSLISPEHAGSVFYHDGDGVMVPDLIEQQIDYIYERSVKTASGGRVVFDITEAMVTIDVNSAQMRGYRDIEETALRANMEAAEIIASHLRLRDLGGLIVVDFIDMGVDKNRRKLEEYFIKLLRKDRARVQWTPISRFGLIEISRQRLSRPIEESQSTVCHACHGTGRHRRPESFALRLLRHIQTQLRDQDVGALVAQVPTDTAVYLLNEKRVELRRLEDEHDCEILISPTADMHPPDFTIRKINKKDSNINLSYEATSTDNNKKAGEMVQRYEKKQRSQPTAVIKTIMPEERDESGKAGRIGGFGQWLRGMFASSPPAEDKSKQATRQEGKPQPKKQSANSSSSSPASSSAATNVANSTGEKKKRSTRRRPIRRQKTPGEQTESSVTAKNSAQSPADKTESNNTPAAAKTPAVAKTPVATTQSSPPSDVAKDTAKAAPTDASTAAPLSAKPTADKNTPAVENSIDAAQTTKSSDNVAADTADNSDKNINQAVENSADSASNKETTVVSADTNSAPSGENTADKSSTEVVRIPYLLSRLAVQYDKTESDIRKALQSLGCDIDISAATHAEISKDVEKRLGEYFRPAPLIIEEDSGLIMVETSAEITSKDNMRSDLSEAVRVLPSNDSAQPLPSAETTIMKQVETGADEKS